MTDTRQNDDENVFAGLSLARPSRETERAVFASAAVALSRRRRRRRRSLLAAAGLACGVALALGLYVANRDLVVTIGDGQRGVRFGIQQGRGVFAERVDGKDGSALADPPIGSPVAPAAVEPRPVQLAARSTASSLARAVAELRAELDGLRQRARPLEDLSGARDRSFLARLEVCREDLERLEWQVAALPR